MNEYELGNLHYCHWFRQFSEWPLLAAKLICLRTIRIGLIFVSISAGCPVKVLAAEFGLDDSTGQ